MIFGWVLHQQETIDTILSRLPLEGVEIINISLLASPEALRTRLERDMADGRRPRDGVVERSLAYLPLYEKLNTWKLGHHPSDSGGGRPRRSAGFWGSVRRCANGPI